MASTMRRVGKGVWRGAGEDSHVVAPSLLHQCPALYPSCALNQTQVILFACGIEGEDRNALENNALGLKMYISEPYGGDENEALCTDISSVSLGLRKKWQLETV
jgi:hypothetical protein